MVTVKNANIITLLPIN